MASTSSEQASWFLAKLRDEKEAQHLKSLLSEKANDPNKIDDSQLPLEWLIYSKEASQYQSDIETLPQNIDRRLMEGVSIGGALGVVLGLIVSSIAIIVHALPYHLAEFASIYPLLLALAGAGCGAISGGIFGACLAKYDAKWERLFLRATRKQ